jgi:AraC family transcriptional regulator, arabinose operon regulatory protein
MPNSSDTIAQAFAPRVRIYLQEGIASLTAMAPAPGIRMARHDAFIVLSAPGSGRFTIATDAGEHSVDAVAIAATTPFSLRSNGAHLICIAAHLVHPLYKALRVHLDPPIRPLERQAFAHLDADLQLAGTGALGLDDSVRLTRQVLEIVLRDAPAVPPLDPRIARIMRRMDADFSCTFDQLARELGLSPSRLSHLFTKELGVPFRSYIAWSRLVLAWEMVALQPQMSFTDIAHAWGFSDSSHMARAFHTSLGSTPTFMRDRRWVEIIGRPMPKGQHVPADAQFQRGWPSSG